MFIGPRFDLYKVQNEKLDKLHLKEHIDELVSRQLCCFFVYMCFEADKSSILIHL